MSNTLRIKRRVSGSAGAPSNLKNAELAFNEVDNTLYYGKGLNTETGNAEVVIPIGGNGNFVDLSSNQTIGGTKTFSNAIVGNLSGNASSANKLNDARNISISSDATGSVSFDGTQDVDIVLTLANSGVTAGAYGSGSSVPVITVDAKGRVTSVSTASVATDLSIAGNTGTDTLSLLTDTLNIQGNSPISVHVTDNLFTISAADATTSTKGVASFDSNTTTVTSGVVAVKSTTLGTSTLTPGSTTNTLAGLQQLDVDNIRIDGNEISATDTDGSISLKPNGDGTVDVNSKRITGVAEPTGAQDAATKNYVDLHIQGLDPKQSVRAATTSNLASLSGELTIDGVALSAGDRILVKDQEEASENGVYVVASGAWSRSLDMNAWEEFVSAYLFVEEGAVNADNGFLCTVDQGGTLGTTAVTFVQFNGAGQVIAGNGLTKTGNQVDVGTASSSRIVVNADNIDLATTTVTPGTYTKVTVDAYGRATAGESPTTLSGYGITDAQPLDATLTALAGITTAADQVIYSTGADTFSVTGLTSFGRSLIDDADAATARGTLGLGTMSTQDANNVAITGGTIDGITFDMGTF
jgi:hypothetical protein